MNLLTVLAILALSLEAGRRWPGARPYLFGPVTVAAHSTIFYLFVLLSGLPGPHTSLWSALLRLHIYLVILALLVAMFAVALSPAPPDDEAHDG